jgi:S1-C subfamily serine protease
MRKPARFRLVCVTLLISAPIGATTLAQVPNNLAAPMPVTGEPASSQDAEEAKFPGIPVLSGISFEATRDLLKGLVDEDRIATRGAREIAIFREAAPAVVLIQTANSTGSGIILQSGLILTNRHVVEGVGSVQICFKPYERDGKVIAETRRGTIKCVDPRRDLALVEPESLPRGFRYLTISSASNFDVGDDVYAIGHPLGIYTWTFTQGIISAVRDINTNDQHYTAIQTQTPINPGNSGGPLLNTAMEVVGINTWASNISSIEKKEVNGEQLPITRPAQGLNFAVSASDLRAFISDAASGKLATLALEIPVSPPGCSGQTLFNGRTKSGDAGLMIFSIRCDGKPDAWEIFPDDKSKPIEFHLDPDRTGMSSIVVFSNPSTGKWDTSRWDLYRDRTFAVVGIHDNGSLQPTRFEYAKS